MPEGGRLTIGTEDVHLGAVDVAEQEGAAPGKYVEISVADTGIGMDEATRARAFEPFFTTKPLGQGTGLGLSQAYGFVRQSNGVLRLESTPGRGTVVRLYLPRHAPVQAPQAGEHLVGAAAEAAGTGGTVLLVEDEVGVRTMASEHLRELGYAVLEAANGSEALRVLHDSRGAHVDMLVTDVGLPGGLNGRQVADMARQRLPSLPVLFITGYTGGAIESALPAGMAMIGKPFTLDVLATRVRSMIEGQDQPNSKNSSKRA
jgi:CheY-like chemotaxis protein